MTGRGRPKAKPTKRANGEGAKPQWLATKNRWRVRVTTAGGPRDRLFKTETEAWAFLSAPTTNTRTGDVLTVGELATKWMDRRSSSWSIARRNTLSKQVRHNIVEHRIGRMRVDRLTVDDVEAWLQEFADRDLAEASIKTYRGQLSTAFNWGRKRNEINVSNPVDGAEWPKGVRPTLPKGFLDLDQATRLVEHCASEHEQWGPYFITLALLGLRPGEAAGLRWDMVHWDEGYVNIASGLKRTGGRAVELGDTKTHQTRALGTPPEVMDALRRQRDAQEVARMVYADEWPDEWDGLVFLAPASHRNAKAGHPPDGMTFLRHLTRICAEVGIPRVTPYELRHACASILLDRKVPPHVVAKLLGTSERMLREHYGHLIDPVLREGVAVWQAAKIDGETRAG